MKQVTLKDRILDKIDELDIFQHYLGSEIKLGKPIKSPLREEKHPSFNVYRSPSNGKLYYKDFADERGDCFKFVMRLFGCTFSEALHIVAQDFSIDVSKKMNTSEIRRIAKKIRIPQLHIPEKKILNYERLSWNPKNLSFWHDYGILEAVLVEYNVWPVAWVDVPKKDGSGVFRIEWKDDDPIYCFDYGNGDHKFYRPKCKDKRFKFISNTRKENIFGLKQLEECGQILDVLIICAGQKDCLSLFSNIGVRGIALNSESAGISTELFIRLKHYAKKVLVCYDNDDTGIKHAKKIKDEIGIDYLDLGTISTPDVVNDTSDYFLISNGLPKDPFINMIANHE